MTIIKVYKVSYAMGIINPIECTIEIESVNDLTEDYIINYIESKRPQQTGQIMAILSTLLIDEKKIGNEEEKIQKEETKKIPVFNWNA